MAYYLFFFRRFFLGLKEPRHSETISSEEKSAPPQSYRRRGVMGRTHRGGWVSRGQHGAEPGGPLVTLNLFVDEGVLSRGKGAVVCRGCPLLV